MNTITGYACFKRIYNKEVTLKITDDLITKFLNDRCNGEEADAIRQYLKQHPDLLDDILPQSEWDQLQTAKTGLNKSSARAIKRKLMQVTSHHTTSQLKGGSCRKLTILSIAALIILTLLLMKLCSRPQKEALLSMLPSS